MLLNDFDTTGPDSGWSLQTTTSCSGDVILGGYDTIAGGTITNLVSIPWGHTQARVVTEYWFVDSWDGETGWIDIDGSNLWYQVRTTGGSGTSDICGATWTEETTLIDGIISHSGSTLYYSAGSNLDQAATDESWAIDDVQIWVR